MDKNMYEMKGLESNEQYDGTSGNHIFWNQRDTWTRGNSVFKKIKNWADRER